MKTGNVGVAFFGDGAANNGAFHEGLNLASIWKLPVLFVCENNQFATEVPFASVAGNPSVAARGAAYGIASIEVDGNDVLAVETAAREAVKRARNGEGPTLIECKTYRTRAHAEGMGDFTYRTREDVEQWKTRCPIARLKKHLLDQKIASAAELSAIEQEVATLTESAHEFAEKSAYPNAESATTHVYATPRSGPPRDVPASTANTRELTFMKATLEALTEEMAHNPKIFVMGEGIGVRGGNFATTSGLFAIHGPERLRDTPICERGFVGLAGGAAMTGTRPVVDFMFADFVLDSVGEIINQIAKMQYMSSGRLKMPVLLRGCIGIGHNAATHHSGNYYSMYAHFPGLRVVVPSSPRDAKGLLKTALTCDDPVLFLEHRELMTVKGPVPEEEYFIDFGQAAIVREGSYVNLGTGIPTMVSNYLEGRVVTLHAENGVLGYGKMVFGDQVDPDMYNASGQYIELMPGASFFDSVTSFEMARGGRIDTVILGAYEVDQTGSVANWSVADAKRGGIGGAMDLISGRTELIIVMEHCDSKGRPKLKKKCAYPLTGQGCVSYVVTDLALLKWDNDHFTLLEVAPGFTAEEVIALTDMQVVPAPGLKFMA
jgi:3-oxoacid CoA-transferase B subunit